MISRQSKIKHLYWRAGFGISPNEWPAITGLKLSQAVDRLFDQAQQTTSPSIPYTEETAGAGKMDKKARREQEKKRLLQQNAAWMARMANPDESAFLEKMSLFWHGHFACILKGSKVAALQMGTIRKHALGSFRDMLHAIAKDPAMIRFLNNQQNKKASPNENFARELLELFTLGRGHYTEQDIKETARAFTGWSSNLRGKFIFRRRQHDFGTKTFMGHTGKLSGEEVIDIILDKPECATFIVRKIYRYFVNEKAPEARIRQLSQSFYQSNYQIGSLMRQIFDSDWFYDQENIGNRIKSPVELLAGIMRTLGVTFEEAKAPVFVQKALGQVLYKPPNVAGWPGGKAWIDNSTLMLRLNLVAYLFQAVDVNFRVKDEFEAKKRNKAIKKIKASVDLRGLEQIFATNNTETLLSDMKTFLLQAPLSISATDWNRFLDSSSRQNYIRSLALRLMSTPEYQLC